MSSIQIDTTKVVTGGHDGFLNVIDVVTGNIMHTKKAHEGRFAITASTSFTVVSILFKYPFPLVPPQQQGSPHSIRYKAAHFFFGRRDTSGTIVTFSQTSSLTSCSSLSQLFFNLFLPNILFIATFCSAGFGETPAHQENRSALLLLSHYFHQ